MHGLYTHQGLKSFFQLHQAEDEVLFYSIYIPYSPLGYKMYIPYSPLGYNMYIPYSPLGYKLVQLNAALPQTFKPGPL